MSPISDERLEEIRSGRAPHNHAGQAERDVRELLAEVDRLRARVAELEGKVQRVRDLAKVWEAVPSQRLLDALDGSEPTLAVRPGPPSPAPAANPRKGESVDLVAALRASIEAAKARRLAVDGSEPRP